MSSEKQESQDSHSQLEEWERILKQESGQSLADRKSSQLAKLQQIVNSLYSHFGSILIPTVKKIRGEALNQEESQNLVSSPDGIELSERIKGLIKEFYADFYKALEAATGISFVVSKQPPPTASKEEINETVDSEVAGDSTKGPKLPKGFNKWDLKLIKLHESRPSINKRIWVEFWTLKGITGLGEILYNSNKDLFYFKPHDMSEHSFAVTEEHGRKVTSQGRNYYFRVSPNPPVEN